jgi:hypothetical protein
VSYGGIYRAKAIKLTGSALTAYVPQVFGDTQILIENFVGTAPSTDTMGWVAFHGGSPEFPVWIAAGVDAGSVTSQIAAAVDAAPYVKRTGDLMTGILQSNRTGAANFDGAVHVEILSNGTQIGRITRATSTTAGFVTSSDADLKENFTAIDDSLAMQWMTTITPWFFNYKDKPDVRHVGYNAQEVAAQWPNGVSNGIIVPGHGDVNARTWDENGQETTPREVWESWMMDHSKITPILHACLLTMDRKVNNRFAMNTARIAALEQVVATQAGQITALQQLAADHTTQINALLQTTAQQSTMITALQQTDATHTSQIAANTAGITKNTTDITKNTADIAANKAAITSNSQGVGTLRTDVFNTRRFVAYWQFSNTVTAPPGAGQMRTSTDNLTMWLHKVDTEGYDRAAQFTMLTAGVQIAIRSTNGRTVNFRSTAAPIDSGTYYTIPVAIVSGTNDFKGVRVEVTIRTGIWATDTPP